MAISTVSYINVGDGNHPIDAITVNGLSFTSEEKAYWNGKQDALTFDSTPLENSNNPVKSGGIYDMITDNEYVIAAALNDLNDRVTELEGFEESDPTVPAWAKSETKPSYTASEVGALSSSTVIPTVDDFFDEVEYDSNAKRINFKNGSTVKKYIDATAFIKDGMIDNVTTSTPSSGTNAGVECLVVTFNTDASKDSIEVPLWKFFNSNNYYSKGDADSIFIKASSMDSVPTQNSNNPVKSSGLYSAITSINARLSTLESASESDPVFSTSPAYNITVANISDWNSKISGVNFNGSSATVTSGVAYISSELNDLSDVNVSNPSNGDVLKYDSSSSKWVNSTDAKMYLGTCGTAAATAKKVVTVDTFPLDENGKPLKGTFIGVKFTNTNSASAPTLNVNGTGDIGIYYGAAVVTSTSSNYGGSAGRYAYYVYNGTNWVWVSHGTDTNDNTLAYNVRYNSASKTITNAVSRYRILFTSADDQHWVPATSATTSNSISSRTVCSTPINPFGPIVYYGSTTSVAASGTPSASVLYTQYALTLGYSFNRTGAALQLTSKNPVYIKCAPQADGSAIIDADTPYVQSLPSTEDGKIYIYLGVASSATAVEMAINHPVYYYKDGAIRQWTNAYESFTGMSLNGASVSVSNGIADISALTDISFIGASVAVSNGVASISLTYDSLPTENSDNLVKSGDLYTVITQNEYVEAAAMNNLNDRITSIASNAVLTSTQSLTSAQQMQARSNQGLYCDESKSGATITWNGDVSSGYNSSNNFNFGGIDMYKVASGPVGMPLSALGPIQAYKYGTLGTYNLNWSYQTTGDGADFESGEIIMGYTNDFWVWIVKDGVINTGEEGGLPVDDGIYFFYSDTNTYVSSLTIYDYSEIHKVENKYLPVCDVQVSGSSVVNENGIASIAIPAVGNGKITFQKNGTTFNSFNVNTGSNKTINIAVNELPSVSSSDNGKILMVSNGSWTLVSLTSIYNI